MNSIPSWVQNPSQGAPQRLGRYSLRYRVAQGGMASVYLAQLKATEGFYKWVAIKTIHPHIAEDPKFVRMFLDEARLAARLDHPNVCSVFDFGKVDDVYYLAMEYLDGETLAAIAQRRWKPRGPGLAPCIGARIVADAARGIHSAHELRNEDGRLAGVVHRDISPQNIFVLHNGVSKVMDFGIAHSSESAEGLTATGELKGKLPYMSPEQMNHERCDRQTDVWALGAVLWEVTVGKRLFKRETEPMTILAVTDKPIPRPSVHRKEYPAELERIVMRALERDRKRRYLTAAEMARDLDAFIAHSPEPAYVDDVSAMMNDTFADRIEFRRQLLQRGTAESPLEVVVTEPSSPSGVQPPRRSAPSEEDADPTIQVDQLPDFGFDAPIVPPKVIPVEQYEASLHTRMKPIAAEARRVPGPATINDAMQFESTQLPDMPEPVTVRQAVPGVAPYSLRSAEPSAVTEPMPYAAAPARVAPVSPALSGAWFALVAVVFVGAIGGSYVWFKLRAQQPAASVRNVAVSSSPAVVQQPSPPPAAPAPVLPAAAPIVAPPPPAAAPPQPIAPIADRTQPAAPPENHAAAHVASPPHEHEHNATRPEHATHAAASEPETSAPIARPGYLFVRSSQPAEVFEGSHSLGHTPVMDHELSAGRHMLHLVSSSASRDVQVEIQAGASAMVSVNW